MGHYPSTSSDLGLDAFIGDVLLHNERVARGDALPSSRRGSRGKGPPPVRPQQHLENADEDGASVDDHVQLDENELAECERREAASFRKEVDRELPGGTFTACVGSRRDLQYRNSPVWPKGVKLDFKQMEAVEPTLRYLKEKDAATKLGGHLWLNADVFAGPGALLSPIDPQEFVRLCAKVLPEAVLSLSWGSSLLSTKRLYTPEMVGSMVELCMTPLVLSRGEQSEHDAGGGGEDGVLHLTPAAVCRHITFAVAAEYALGSRESLRELLRKVPGSSLTIFSGVGSLGIDTSALEDLINSYGAANLFLDLKLTKNWRTCSHGTCCVQ